MTEGSREASGRSVHVARNVIRCMVVLGKPFLIWQRYLWPQGANQEMGPSDG